MQYRVLKSWSSRAWPRGVVFGEAKVAKALISKADLERIALQEIRNFPGSEHVLSVEVEGETGAPRGIDWRLYVMASDEGDLDRIQYAVKVATDRLKRRYDLQPS
ncbi:hypothetical protein [Bradyrhizobium monzae]|uniref:hypothetical protein n=1 Tax=Bradyrhizobium sp. Oc8 TaxID=2876780 RepID=UPI001F1DC92F